MGGKSSKEKKNQDLKEIGEKANREDPNSFHYSSTFVLTNKLIVSQSKADPTVDYIKFLGRRFFCYSLSCPK